MACCRRRILDGFVLVFKHGVPMCLMSKGPYVAVEELIEDSMGEDESICVRLFIEGFCYHF